MYTKVKTDTEIAAMRKAGKILATVLREVSSQVRPGVTTKELSDFAEKRIIELGGTPSFKGYNGFTDALCTSVNDAVVHGIPSDLPLQNGDVVGLDLGVTCDGMIVDGAITVAVDPANPEVSKLLEVTKKSLHEGLKQIKDGCFTGDVGAAVESVLSKNNYGIVRELVGHGVGHQVHEDPNIPNYGKKRTGDRLVSGMTIAVEPMATLGKEDIYIDKDKWTVRTKDGSIAAHFEHTVLVTDKGYEILTLAD